MGGHRHSVPSKNTSIILGRDWVTVAAAEVGQRSEAGYLLQVEPIGLPVPVGKGAGERFKDDPGSSGLGAGRTEMPMALVREQVCVWEERGVHVGLEMPIGSQVGGVEQTVQGRSLGWGST